MNGQIQPPPSPGMQNASNTFGNGPGLTPQPKRSRKAPWVAASIITLGFYLVAARSYGTDFGNGLLWAATFGLPALGIVLAISYLLARLATRWIRPLVLIVASGVLACALVAYGFASSQPLDHFETYVLSPAPESVTNLYVRSTSSYSDGSSWFFRFTTDLEDFEAICRKHSLLPVPYDFAERQALIAEFSGHDIPHESIMHSVFPEDRDLAQLFEDDYRRPSEPQFFKAPKMTVVRDPQTSEVSILLFTRTRKYEEHYAKLQDQFDRESHNVPDN